MDEKAILAKYAEAILSLKVKVRKTPTGIEITNPNGGVSEIKFMGSDGGSSQSRNGL